MKRPASVLCCISSSPVRWSPNNQVPDYRPDTGLSTTMFRSLLYFCCFPLLPSATTGFEWHGWRPLSTAARWHCTPQNRPVRTFACAIKHEKAHKLTVLGALDFRKMWETYMCGIALTLERLLGWFLALPAIWGMVPVGFLAH